MSNGRSGTIVIWILVGFIAIGSLSWWQWRRIAGCCEELKRAIAKIQPTPDQPTDVRPGPGPGPIISVSPKKVSGKYYTEWKYNGSVVPTSVGYGDAGKLREDATTSVREFFDIELESGNSSSLLWVQIELESGDTIWIAEQEDGTLKWYFNEDEIDTCDLDGNGVDDCTASGIPPEFDGEIADINTHPPLPGQVNWTKITKVRMDLDF